MRRRVASRNLYTKPISLSDAFEKISILPIPTQINILNFFDQASQASKNIEKLNLLVPYWQAIAHYDFPQRQLTRILKGLHVFLGSDLLTESVKEYFMTNDALKIWHDNFKRLVHSLATDYLVEDLITFHEMGIRPTDDFLAAFEKNITVKRLTPALLVQVPEMLANFGHTPNTAFNIAVPVKNTHNPSP